MSTRSTWKIWLNSGRLDDTTEVTAETFSIGDTGVLIFTMRGEVIAAFGKNAWMQVRIQ